MNHTARQIEAHIEDTREALGTNLQELEYKVKSVTDWRQYFRTHPLTMLGVACGGGVLLAAMVAGHKNRRSDRVPDQGVRFDTQMGNDHLKDKALDTWDNIKGALMGVAATRITDFIGEIVPGFHEQFRHLEEKDRGSVRSSS